MTKAIPAVKGTDYLVTVQATGTIKVTILHNRIGVQKADAIARSLAPGKVKVSKTYMRAHGTKDVREYVTA